MKIGILNNIHITMTNQDHKEIAQNNWKNKCKPEDVNLLAPNAPVEFGYVLIIEYDDKRIFIASTKKPTTYVNTLLRMENKIGASVAINVRINCQCHLLLLNR